MMSTTVVVVCNQNKDQKGIFPRDTPGLTLKLLDCYN